MVTVEVWCVQSATHLPRTYRYQNVCCSFFFNSFVMAWTVTGLWCNLVEMLGIVGAQEPSSGGCL